MTDNSTRFPACSWRSTLVLLAIAVVLGAGIGVYIAKRNLFPVTQAGEVLRIVRHKLFPSSPVLGHPIHMSDDQIKELITFRTVSDVVSGREILKRKFQGAGCLYDPRMTNISRIARIKDDNLSPRTGTSILVALPLGFEVRARYFRSISPSRILVIYHTGHGGQTEADSLVMSKILGAGVDVIAVDLPLIGQNNQPVVTIPRIGTIRLTHHNQLALLETTDFNPMMLFVEPIACLINHLSSTENYKKIVQMGISGGGFVATLNAALDPRISATYSVGGQLPVFLRSSNPTTDWGDYEQINQALYRHITDLDLYVMAAQGNGREYIQIFNEFDPCCYRGRGHESYSNLIENQIQVIGPGKFGVWLDSNNFSHAVSEKTAENIIRALLAEPAGLGQ